MSAHVQSEGKGHPKSPRPDGVPRLQLDAIVGDHPEDRDLENPIAKYNTFHTPASKSTVSWGTPHSQPYALTKKDIEFGGTVYRPCTHIGHNRPNSRRQQRNPITHEETPHRTNISPHSPKYKDQPVAPNKKENLVQQSHDPVKAKPQPQHKNISPRVKTVSPRQEMNKSPRQHKVQIKSPPKKGEYWYLDDHLKPRAPSPEPEETGYTIDELAQMQAENTSQPYTGLHGARKSAAEDDLAKKQKEEIMEQVLVDQLSRHVISDVEQDRDPARQNPADPSSMYNTAPIRFRSRRLHDTKVSTAGAATESKLKDRITFGARLLTRNGRDALRDLFGFYFHTDQTLTVYEYRIFGKNNNKALPVIERGKYSHVTGRRKGKKYGAEDIQVGKNISFNTANQPSLPDTMKRSSSILFRIYETSSSSSSASAGWDIPSSDRDGGSDTALERRDRKITSEVQRFVRNKLQDRSVSVLVGMGRMFRSLDTSGDGLLSKDELYAALQEFDIRLPNQDFEAVWRVVDENNDGAIDYGEFMRAFIGEMNEVRKQIVRKVFKKLDPHKSGFANLLDLQKLYSAKRHPLVVAGNYTQAEMEEQFVTSVADVTGSRDGRISYSEFVDYYEGLSLAMKNDDDFVNMMRNCWGV